MHQNLEFDQINVERKLKLLEQILIIFESSGILREKVKEFRLAVIKSNLQWLLMYSNSASMH
jgi:hypothetical protein